MHHLGIASFFGGGPGRRSKHNTIPIDKSLQMTDGGVKNVLIQTDYLKRKNVANVCSIKKFENSYED